MGPVWQAVEFMAMKLLTTLLIVASVAMGPADVDAAEPSIAHDDFRLSPALLELLRAEMREIAGGVQGIAFAVATADWNTIQETGARLRASYVMEKELTAEQARELVQSLPERFKRLDAEFHRRAQRLADAGAAHDYELVVFQYSRLMENCAQCHSVYARSRFPGFDTAAPQGHKH
jgi:cytochrome c556